MKKLAIAIIAWALIVGSAFTHNGNKKPLIGSKTPSIIAKSTEVKTRFSEDNGIKQDLLFSQAQVFNSLYFS